MPLKFTVNVNLIYRGKVSSSSQLSRTYIHLISEEKKNYSVVQYGAYLLPDAIQGSVWLSSDDTCLLKNSLTASK